MRKIRILLLSLLFIQFLPAQDNTFEFLRLHSSPRAEALAGNFITNTDDPSVMFYNPAGIFSLEKNPVSFSFLNYLADIKVLDAAFSTEFEGIGRFGVAIKYLNYGDFIKADASGNKLGDFGVNDLALLVGYGYQLHKNFNIGANAKFIYSKIDDASSTGLAVDLGAQYFIRETNWVIAFSVLNLGSQISEYYSVSEDLPLDIRLGVSKKLEHLPFKFYFSFIKLNKDVDNFGDRFKNFTFGGELFLGKALTVRLGYDNQKREDLKIGTSTGLAGYSLGVGLKVKEYKIDYAFSSHGSVPSVHRFGIVTAF